MLIHTRGAETLTKSRVVHGRERVITTHAHLQLASKRPVHELTDQHWQRLRATQPEPPITTDDVLLVQGYNRKWLGAHVISESEPGLVTYFRMNQVYVSAVVKSYTRLQHRTLSERQPTTRGERADRGARRRGRAKWGYDAAWPTDPHKLGASCAHEDGEGEAGREIYSGRAFYNDADVAYYDIHLLPILGGPSPIGRIHTSIITFQIRQNYGAGISIIPQYKTDKSNHSFKPVKCFTREISLF